MANQDPQKVFVSFAGKSVTGWGEDGPTIQRAERVQTNWGLQGYAESQQHYDGDRTITLSLYVSSEGYKYINNVIITELGVNLLSEIQTKTMLQHIK